MTNWTTIGNDALKAAEAVIKGEWPSVSAGATSAIASLVLTAQYIEANRNLLSDAQAGFLAAQQKAALQNVLTAYASIGLATAQAVLAAVIQAVISAVPTLAAIL